MFPRRIIPLAGAMTVAGVLAACGATPQAQPDIVKIADAARPLSAAAASPPVRATSAPASSAERTLPTVLVHKSQSCGCCGLWVDHLRAAGFAVEVRNSDDLQAVKQRLGIGPSLMSCHTAEVGGYFVEGHVPAADIQRLLAEKPDVKGLVLPGMPMGSPGMEMPDGRVQPYVVSSVDKQGQLSDYAHHGH